MVAAGQCDPVHRCGISGVPSETPLGTPSPCLTATADRFVGRTHSENGDARDIPRTYDHQRGGRDRAHDGRRRGPSPDRAELEETRLPVGQLAHDARQERRGIVMDHQDGFVWLRPEGGGTEWTARPGDVQSLNVREQAAALMRARVATANARSRGEVL